MRLKHAQSRLSLTKQKPFSFPEPTFYSLSGFHRPREELWGREWTKTYQQQEERLLTKTYCIILYNETLTDNVLVLRLLRWKQLNRQRMILEDQPTNSWPHFILMERKIRHVMKTPNRGSGHLKVAFTWSLNRCPQKTWPAVTWGEPR